MKDRESLEMLTVFDLQAAEIYFKLLPIIHIKYSLL